ncbi:YciI family protein [Streptococcus mutans]|uniref:YciI family protein n=1 Tax=Streptococcus mutans TaxID=1309 RepID=UPI0018ABFB66|nr:YciI family protein [Streptococcus mutans]
MFIINLTYQKNLIEVEKHLEAHIQFLDTYYASGHFIASGRKNPRTGGIILAKAADLAEIERIISEDPFKINEIANYDIIEFCPTKSSKAFEKVLK